MVQARRPTLPNLIVIGAMKCSTTSLHHYLSLHPEIYMSKQKELNFFDERLRWHKGIDWYASQFDASYSINGESCPQYTIFPTATGVPQRMSETLRSPKFIYLVRDPIDRLLSHQTEIMDLWPHARAFNVADLSFETSTAVQCSFYYRQIAEYLRFFSRDSILVLLAERLNSNPREEMKRIFKFLNVDDNFWSDEIGVSRLNEGRRKRFVAQWFSQSAPAFLKEPSAYREWMPWPMQRALHGISRIGGKPIKKPTITVQEDEILQKLFREDVATLRHFLSDPLVEWRPYQ
jgi:hypothetical protein